MKSYFSKFRKQSGLFRLTTFWILFYVSFLSINIKANVASPNQGGAAGAEPAGLEKIYILRENLSIDLRGLAEGLKNNPYKILVKAEYEIENRGEEQNLELVFVFGSIYKDFKVYLDDAEIASHDYNSPSNAKPRGWDLPKKTPWTDGKGIDYEMQGYNVSNQAFSLKIPAGKHRLRAEYRGVPSSYADTPTKYWQFAYILAPAKDWAGFGGLDLTIYAPDNFTVVTDPKLTQNGSTLTGHFDKLPADAISLTARYNVPASYQTVQTISVFLLLIALIGFPILMMIYAIWKGYKKKPSWTWGLGLPLLWSLLILGAGWLSIFASTYMIPDGLYNEYGYGSGLGIVFIIIFAIAAFPVGIGLWFLTVFLTKKFRKPETTEFS